MNVSDFQAGDLLKFEINWLYPRIFEVVIFICLVNSNRHARVLRSESGFIGNVPLNCLEKL